jgi:hypothetical protein
VTISPSLSSVVASIANSDAQKARNSLDTQGLFSSDNVVAEAQADAAKQKASQAKTDAANASAFASLEAKGISVQDVSFDSILKGQMISAIDPNNTGTVSAAALTNMVEAGGGTAAQAQTLYHAMDENGNGVVSDQEYADSIPVPQYNGGIGLAMKASLGSNRGDPILDASLIMGNLAVEQSEYTPAAYPQIWELVLP